jgi:hypothetical protein
MPPPVSPVVESKLASPGEPELPPLDDDDELPLHAATNAPAARAAAQPRTIAMRGRVMAPAL